jgi:hypothetical protein
MIRAVALLLLAVAALSAPAGGQGGDPASLLDAAQSRSSRRLMTEVHATALPKRISIKWIDTGIISPFVGRYEDIPSLFISPSPPAFQVDVPIAVHRLTTHGRIGELADTIYYKILDRTKSSQVVEIRSFEDITFVDYLDLDASKQAEALEFTTVFLGALYLARQRLEREGYDVDVIGAVGSNACHIASLVIPSLADHGSNPVDQLLMFDGRAFIDDVALLIQTLGQRVVIFNTAGDAPTWPTWFFFGRACMIADLDCSKILKKLFPQIRLFFAADGWHGFQWFVGGHTGMMHGDRLADVKEYLAGGHYRHFGQLSGRALASLVEEPMEPKAPHRAALVLSPDRRGSLQADASLPRGDDGLRRCRPGEVGCTFHEERLPPYPPCPPWLPECWPPLVREPPPPCQPGDPDCPPLDAEASSPCPPGDPDCVPRGVVSPLPDFLRVDICPIFKPVPDLYGASPSVLDILISK